MTLYEEIEHIRIELNQRVMTWWTSHTVFSLNWWIITLFNVICFVLFLMLIDRKRKNQIWISFFVAFVFVGLADESGMFFHFWSYPYEFLPFTQRFNAVNFLAIPCLFALIYQFFTRWSKYLVAAVILSVVNSYVGEPLFVFVGIYKLNNWSFTKSFMVIFVIGVIVKFLADLITTDKVQEKFDREININFPSKEKIR